MQARLTPMGRRDDVALSLIPLGPSVVITGGTPISLNDFVIPPKAPALPGSAGTLRRFPPIPS